VPCEEANRRKIIRSRNVRFNEIIQTPSPMLTYTDGTDTDATTSARSPTDHDNPQEELAQDSIYFDTEEPSLLQTPPPLRRSARLQEMHLTELRHLVEYNATFTRDVPRSIHEALNGPRKEKWHLSLAEEVVRMGHSTLSIAFQRAVNQSK
jgi:hypothetical protein